MNRFLIFVIVILLVIIGWLVFFRPEPEPDTVSQVITQIQDTINRLTDGQPLDETARKALDDAIKSLEDAARTLNEATQR